MSIKDNLVSAKQRSSERVASEQRWSLPCDNELRDVGYGDDPKQAPPTPTPTMINNSNNNNTTKPPREVPTCSTGQLWWRRILVHMYYSHKQRICKVVLCLASDECLTLLGTSQRSATAACSSPTVAILSAAKPTTAMEVCYLSQQQRVPRRCSGWHCCCFLCWYHQNCCSSQREQQCW